VLPILRQLADVPPGEWRYLASQLRFEHLDKHQALTQAGHVADRLGFVVSGLIRKLHVTERGRPIVRGFGGPGMWVGAYASLLTGQPSYLTVEAIVPSELFVLDWSVLETLYARHSCWLQIGRRMAEMFLLEREARAHELLTLSAGERYAAFCRSHRDLLPLLRHYDVASYLGITPVSLSRLRARAGQIPAMTPPVHAERR
jgi:CRP-like cAMP-binding protein